MPLTGPRQLTETDISTLSTTAQDDLGAQGIAGDGRLFRYVKFGGTSTVNSGLLLVAVAAPANSTGLAIPASGSSNQTTANLSLGSYQLVVTNGATAVTQDEFALGYLEVIGTNSVNSYKIRGNTADSAGSAAITIYLSEPLRNTTALANGTNTVNLRKSPWDSPAASLTQALPVGVTIQPVANTATVTNYGWVQTGGMSFASATSGTKGQPVTQDLSGTAGFVANTGSGAAETVPQVGIFKESAASSTASVWLEID
jgi:hypothetical protein